MALARKGSQIINVDGTAYRWVVSPDSGYMWLIVERAKNPGQRIEAQFDYHDRLQRDYSLVQRRSITLGVVSNIIGHALMNGWQPGMPGLKALRVDGEAVSPMRYSDPGNPPE